jgi:hypothetical protein
LENAVDVRGDEGLAIRQDLEFMEGADAVRRSGPNGVEDGVEQFSALGGVRPASAGSQLCAARRAVAKALKGHCDWLVRTPAPPGTLPGGKGMRLKSSKETVSGDGLGGAINSGGSGCGGPASCAISGDGRASTPAFCFA